MLKVRRSLTEILLEVTNEEISCVCREVWTRYRAKGTTDNRLLINAFIYYFLTSLVNFSIKDPVCNKYLSIIYLLNKKKARKKTIFSAKPATRIDFFHLFLFLIIIIAIIIIFIYLFINLIPEQAF